MVVLHDIHNARIQSRAEYSKTKNSFAVDKRVEFGLGDWKVGVAAVSCLFNY